MKCPKCGSENVNIQAVTATRKKTHGVLWWILVGWWWVPIKWFFFFWLVFIGKLFGFGSKETVAQSMAVCQTCGHHWKIGGKDRV